MPSSKKTVETTIKQQAIEIRAATIFILDRFKFNGDTADTSSGNEGPVGAGELSSPDR